MPQRTNEKQQIIEMLKAMTAAAGWTVRPSGFLLDARLGEHFEVDVVAEKLDDGHSFIQSFEIVGKGRPATLGWIREMIKKHESLPTDRLFLVSWSGFVANAKKEGECYPWVILIEPTIVEHGKIEGIAVILEEVTMTMRHYALFTKADNGTPSLLPVSASSVVIDSKGVPGGHPETLANGFVGRPEFGARAIEVAHSHPKRDTISQFNTSLGVDGLRLITDDIEMPIHEIWLKGDVKWRQERIDMTVRAFGSLRFKHGKGTIGGRSHVIVASLKGDYEIDKINAAPAPSAKKGNQRLKSTKDAAARRTRGKAK